MSGMKLVPLVVFLLFASFIVCADPANDPLRFVDPLIGTQGFGHTHPGAAYPMGMVQAGPDTGVGDWAHCSGYQDKDPSIIGFSQTHLSGTGCPDLGDVSILPFTGEYAPYLKSAREGVFSRPGECTCFLSDFGLDVRITATPHVGCYTIEKKEGLDRVSVLVNLPFGIANKPGTGYAEIQWFEAAAKATPTSVKGFFTRQVWTKRTVGFDIEFDHPATKVTEIPPAEKNAPPVYVMDFDLGSDKELKIKVALSRNKDKASDNLRAEVPDWDFDGVLAKTQEAWRRILGMMTFEGGRNLKVSAYTSLYHLFFQPNNIADAGEEPYYSTLSFWDTFRAAHPLYTILDPKLAGDFVNSSLRHYDRQKFLPIWELWDNETDCMIATHSVPVVVDGALKKLPGVDPQRVWEAVKATQTENHHYGRSKEHWDVLNKYGYFPFDLIPAESVSRTFEVSFDDWCAAEMAKAVGAKEDEAFFRKRSESWKNLLDPETGLARGKDSKGAWRTPFDPFEIHYGNDYTEGNAWQFVWHVLQDIPALQKALGPTNFADKLQRLFTLNEDAGPNKVEDVTGLIGQYAHGNEPSHHVIYLLQYIGRPDLVARYLRQVFDTQYGIATDGLCGNDDCGQMSAWFLFSAMGFYPVNPCNGEYVLGAPQFEKVTVRLPEGKTFTVLAKGLSECNKYVQCVKLNGKPMEGFILRHEQIMAGGTLEFTMGSVPRKVWKADAKPDPVRPCYALFFGHLGEKHNKVCESRIFPLAGADSPIYEEAANAFRTRQDDQDQHQGLWQGEYWGKTMLSLAQTTQHGTRGNRHSLAKALREKTLAFIDEFQQEDGYISTYSNRNFVCQYQGKGYCWNLWGQKYTLWALIEAYRATKDLKILAAAEKMANQQIDLVHSLPVRIVDTGCFAGLPSMSVLKPMLLLYEETCDEKYLDYAKEIVAIWDEEGGCPNLIRNGLSGKEVHTWYPEPNQWAKAYEMMSCLEGLIEFSHVTGDQHVLGAVKGIVAALKKSEGNALGSVGYFDHFTNAAARNNAVTEGCDIVHWMRVCLELEDYDAVEEAFCNAFLASVYRDGAWGAHAVRSAGRSHHSAPHQVGMELHQCCIDNYPRGFRDVLDNQVVLKDGVYHVNTYFEGVQNFSNGCRFSFRDNYPISNTVTVQVYAPERIKGEFRIPGWCTSDDERTFTAEPGMSRFKLTFKKKPKVINSANAVQKYDRFDWHRGLFTFYWEPSGCEDGFRDDPAAYIKYGPLVLARCQQMNSAGGLEDFETINGKGYEVSSVCLEWSKHYDVWGAWNIKLSNGNASEDKEYDVCDFASSADTTSTNNWFSIWF